MRNITLLVLSFCSLGAASCRLAESSAGAGGITVDWIYNEQGRDAAAIPSFAWLSDGTAILHDHRRPESERTLERFDPASGKRAGFVDAAGVLKQLEELLGEGKSPASLDWPAAIDSSGRRGIYLFADDLFALDLSSSTLSRITGTEEKEKSPRLSPDGTRLAFVRKGDLYTWDFKERKEHRLTSDGSDTLLNGTLSWVYWEEVFASAGKDLPAGTVVQAWKSNAVTTADRTREPH